MTLIHHSYYSQHWLHSVHCNSELACLHEYERDGAIGRRKKPCLTHQIVQQPGTLITLMHWDIFVLNIDAENCICNFWIILIAIYIILFIVETYLSLIRRIFSHQSHKKEGHGSKHIAVKWCVRSLHLS